MMSKKKFMTGYPNPSYNDYSNSKIMPTFSVQGGIWYNSYLTKKLILKTGVTYFNRIFKYEGNKDTIIKYRPVQKKSA